MVSGMLVVLLINQDNVFVGSEILTCVATCKPCDVRSLQCE